MSQLPRRQKRILEGVYVQAELDCPISRSRHFADGENIIKKLPRGRLPATFLRLSVFILSLRKLVPPLYSHRRRCHGCCS